MAGRWLSQCVWRVFAQTADIDGATMALVKNGVWLDCGHDHADQAAAEACPWEPDDAPEVYAGAVIQVHPTTFARISQSKMPWAGARPLRQSRRAASSAVDTPTHEREQRQLPLIDDRSAA